MYILNINNNKKESLEVICFHIKLELASCEKIKSLVLKRRGFDPLPLL